MKTAIKFLKLVILLTFIHLNSSAQSNITLHNTSEKQVTFIVYDEDGNYHHTPISQGESKTLTTQVRPYLNMQALENDRNVPYFFFAGDEITITGINDGYYSFDSKNSDRKNELQLSTAIFKSLQKPFLWNIKTAELLIQSRIRIDSVILAFEPNKVSPSFKELLYDYYLYDVLNRQIRNNPEKGLGSTYQSYFKNVYNHSLQSYILAFRTFAITYLPKQIGKDQLLESLDKRFDDVQKEVALYSVMQMAFYKDKEWFRSQYSKYISLSNDTDFVKKLSYFKLTDDMAKTSGEVMLINTSNETTPLNKVLEGLKGKVVLIDLWASWCVPCLLQMPYSTALINTFKGKSFQVLYLSMDREMQLFSVASDKYLKGKLNYNVLSNFTTTFSKLHKITSIPRYMLLDKQGNFVDTNTPYPDDAALKQLIEKYL